MKNIYRRTIVMIPNGQTEAESLITLPSAKEGGRIIALASDGGIAPSKLVSIKIDESGSEIHPFMSHKVYDGGVGSFSQRGIELETNKGGDWTVKAKSTSAVTADTYIEMNFLIQSPESCD